MYDIKFNTDELITDVIVRLANVIVDDKIEIKELEARLLESLKRLGYLQSLYNDMGDKGLEKNNYDD